MRDRILKIDHIEYTVQPKSGDQIAVYNHARGLVLWLPSDPGDTMLTAVVRQVDKAANLAYESGARDGRQELKQQFHKLMGVGA